MQTATTTNSRKPKHVAIIMDGNGRWAQQRNRPRSFGHQAGVQSVRNVVRAAGEAGVEVLTLFAFSWENWSRPAQEVARLMQLFRRALRKEVSELHDNNVRLEFIGDLSRFGAELQQQMRDAMATTANNDGLTLVIAVNYSGRWDMSQAACRFAKAVQSGEAQADTVDQDALAPYLSLSHLPDPDLLIRTGGELRVSNFLLWQLAYAELFFSETYWPDFDAAEFNRIMGAFASRERRFGGVNETASEPDADTVNEAAHHA